MKISFDKDEILSAIDRVAKKTMTMDLTWDWPCGVAYYDWQRHIRQPEKQSTWNF